MTDDRRPTKNGADALSVYSRSPSPLRSMFMFTFMSHSSAFLDCCPSTHPNPFHLSPSIHSIPSCMIVGPASASASLCVFVSLFASFRCSLFVVRVHRCCVHTRRPPLSLLFAPRAPVPPVPVPHVQCLISICAYPRVPSPDYHFRCPYPICPSADLRTHSHVCLIATLLATPLRTFHTHHTHHTPTTRQRARLV